jgi:uncharacterized protein (DUF433 family)
MNYSKIIRIEPGKRSGKPTIRGTRMTVTDVLEYLAGGMSEEEILAEFPDLTSEDIKACLAFAADLHKLDATGLSRGASCSPLQNQQKVFFRCHGTRPWHPRAVWDV